MFLVYVDDCIVFTHKGKEADITMIIKILKGKFELTNEGLLKDYLGIKSARHPDRTLEITQPHLISRIVNALGLPNKIKDTKENPATHPILHKDEEGPARRIAWHYQSLIGMMNYLEKTLRPELAFAVHQCARFRINPKLSHKRAVHRIVKYLVGTKEKGIVFKPDRNQGIKVYPDADFAGSWNNANSECPASVLWRTGFVIMFCGWP